MITQRKISVGPNPGIKHLAKIIYGKTIGLEKLSEIVAETSAVTEGDIYSVLLQTTKVIGWLASEGIPVDLGKFGRFYPKIRAKAVDTYGEVTADTIWDTSIRFMPSVHLRKLMKDTKHFFKEVQPGSYSPRP